MISDMCKLSIYITCSFVYTSLTIIDCKLYILTAYLVRLHYHEILIDCILSLTGAVSGITA